MTQHIELYAAESCASALRIWFSPLCQKYHIPRCRWGKWSLSSCSPYWWKRERKELGCCPEALLWANSSELQLWSFLCVWHKYKHTDTHNQHCSSIGCVLIMDSPPSGRGSETSHAHRASQSGTQISSFGLMLSAALPWEFQDSLNTLLPPPFQSLIKQFSLSILASGSAVGDPSYY
jgi:hypothetical protein